MFGFFASHPQQDFGELSRTVGESNTLTTRNPRARNPNLKRDYKRHFQEQGEWNRRFLAWRQVLENNPSEFALNKIADRERLSDASEKDWLAFLAYLVYLDAMRPQSKAKINSLPLSIWALALLALVIAMLVIAGASDQIGEVVRHWPIFP